MSKIMVAMSGGVDSSVAAALMVEAGHEVTGVTLKLWGGESDSGCCSVSDVDDARRVAQQLGIAHHVFNFGDDFDRHVVEPYVQAHLEGLTPNPCVECNRHIKFDRLLERARVLGFDRLVTGHHVRLVEVAGRPRLARSADSAKDQSYVLHMLDEDELASCEFPLGAMTKDEVRAHASRLGLRTAGKPDSQDVCFISSTGGRADFLGRRGELHAGELVDTDGAVVGSVEHVELVTIGQRRGLDLGGAGDRRYAVHVDVPKRRVVVGTADARARTGPARRSPADCSRRCRHTAVRCPGTSTAGCSGGRSRSVGSPPASRSCSTETTRRWGSSSWAARSSAPRGSTPIPPRPELLHDSDGSGGHYRDAAAADGLGDPATSGTTDEFDGLLEVDLDHETRRVAGAVVDLVGGDVVVGRSRIDVGQLTVDHEERFARGHVIVHDDAGGHEHDPASVQGVDGASSQCGDGQTDRCADDTGDDLIGQQQRRSGDRTGRDECQRQWDRTEL